MLHRIHQNGKAFIIPLSFIIPVLMLYTLDPNSFQEVWKGRAPLLILIWLLILEAFLSKEKLSKSTFESSTSLKHGLILANVVAPTVYVIAFFFLGLRCAIQNLGKFLGVPYGGPYNKWFITDSWPLSFEYLLFGALLILLSFLLYKIKGLRYFSICIFYIFAVGAFYTIDTFYPYGEATVLQAIVPIIVNGVKWILNPMGYTVHYTPNVFRVTVTGSGGRSFAALIYWSCAGVYSMGIYSIVILLFLKDSKISSTGKILCFIVGAIGTFFVNVLRIATIFKLGVDKGGGVADLFHKYYGELFFIAWIIIYPLIIVGSHKMWMKLSKSKTVKDFFKR